MQAARAMKLCYDKFIIQQHGTNIFADVVYNKFAVIQITKREMEVS